MTGILRVLTENRAATDPASPDFRLRGRTYAIPFDDVWSAALRIAGGGLRGWNILSADDQAGVIEATTKTLVFRSGGDVRVEIGLDENAQTRVDLWSASRTHRGDLGRSRRAVGRFLQRLDKRLKARPEQILDASRPSTWLEPQ